MRLTKYTHSCVRVDDDDRHLVIDPGSFSPDGELSTALDGVSAVLLTHEHPDHVDPEAIAGAAATDVPISDWFFIVTTFGSLLMVTGKRGAEAAEVGDDAGDIRPSLVAYTPGFVAYLRSVSSSAVLVAYCLWAFEKAGLNDHSVPWFQLSIVPFALAILRYALLVDAGEGGAPEEVVFRDRSLQVMGVSWVVLFACGVYLT